MGGVKKFQVLAIGGMGYVYAYKGIAYKQNCFARELDMMQQAGDCAVRAIACVISMDDDRPVMGGLLMELLTPLEVTGVKESERAETKDEMIRLVKRLHNMYEMVHGDIKPANMLRRGDGTLCLCDFDSARLLDEDPGSWEGLCTERYLAPNRDFVNTGAAPTPSDDIYALGLSIWELYTGKEALMDEYHNIEEVLRERRTVDVTEIKDEEVRELVRGYLKQGGALV